MIAYIIVFDRKQNKPRLVGGQQRLWLELARHLQLLKFRHQTLVDRVKLVIHNLPKEVDFRDGFEGFGSARGVHIG